MQRLNRIYLTICRASAPGGGQRGAPERSGELTLSLFTSMLVYRLVRAGERCWMALGRGQLRTSLHVLEA